MQHAFSHAALDQRINGPRVFFNLTMETSTGERAGLVETSWVLTMGWLGVDGEAAGWHRRSRASRGWCGWCPGRPAWLKRELTMAAHRPILAELLGYLGIARAHGNEEWLQNVQKREGMARGR